MISIVYLVKKWVKIIDFRVRKREGESRLKRERTRILNEYFNESYFLVDRIGWPVTLSSIPLFLSKWLVILYFAHQVIFGLKLD